MMQQAPEIIARDQPAGLDLYGYAGTIKRGPDLSDAEQAALDAFDRKADMVPLDAYGDRRSAAIKNLACFGIDKGLAVSEILSGCEYAASQSGYQLSLATIKEAVQRAVKTRMGVVDDEPKASASGEASPFVPNASRIGDIFTIPPAAPRFIAQGFYPVACGQENSVGGLGKTTRRIWEAMHLILGRALYGYPVLKPGPVVIVTKEDGADIFKHRIHRVATSLDLSKTEQQQISEHLHVLDLTGDVAARLVSVDRDGNLRATDLAERIYRGYRKEGVVQVVFDPWNAFSPGERFVNDAEASLMVTGALISRELSCNVCYVGHVSKTVGRQGIIDAHSGRGGAAMGDNARFVLNYVPHDSQDDVKAWPAPASAERAAAQGSLFRLHVTKQSYAARPADPIWIERQGYAFTVHQGAPASPTARLDAEGERIKAFVQQELERGVRYMARPLEEQHDRYGLGRNRARQVISRLLSAGGLIEHPLPEAERRGKLTVYLEPIFKGAPELAAGDPFA